MPSKVQEVPFLDEEFVALCVILVLSKNTEQFLIYLTI
jgi:hypothetical protein